jgi:hypothetical protein
VLWVVCLVVGMVAFPDCAVAWGPISHLAHGSELLNTLTTLGAGLQQLLAAHPLPYLYGCIGADITMAKRFTLPMQAHCHSWLVGWQIVDAAETDAERAFAYGYLSHLAADVFSHNHFVPTQLLVSFRARTLRHTYWEARFDSMQSAKYRGVLRLLRRHRFPECDALLRRVVARTIVPFRTGKQIFDSVLAFHDWDNWYHLMRAVSSRSRYNLSPELVARYNDVCLRHVQDVLCHGKRARCQAADPTGLDALTQAKVLRRTLKLLDRRRAVSPALMLQLNALDERSDLAGDQLAAARPAPPAPRQRPGPLVPPPGRPPRRPGCRRSA